MQTYTAPGEQPVAPGDNPVSLLMERATNDPDSIALTYRVAEGFLPITSAEMLAS